ncbi:MAG: VWA domain-containing protein [Thermoplasmata archaeon]|nr:VWA domain-containing protein [Thermoplasmata archaeon]
MALSTEPIGLPDCAKFTDDVVADDLLDLLRSEEVIRALAEGGVEAARALLDAQARSDPRLSERIAELRERLKRQASRRIGRILEDYERRSVQLHTVSRTEQDRLAAELKALEARRRGAKALDFSHLSDTSWLPEITDALLLPDASWNQPEHRSLWQRIRAFFRRLWDSLLQLLGRRRRPTPIADPGRPMTFASLSGSGRSLGPSEVGDVLARLSPAQQEELRDKVARNVGDRERDLQREAEEKRRAAEAQQRALEAEKEEARRRAERDAENRLKEAAHRRFDRELKERGLVDERHGELSVTYGLIERFARIVLEEESRSVPHDVRLSFKGAASTGIYEKARLRQPEEVAHLDLPSSVVAARMEGSRHLDEGHSFIYREITSERVHVVLLLDKSGSMSESHKLDAAKKALLALYVAIRRRHSDAAIDVIAFDNDVRLLDLLELWECPPGSFTNTAEALHAAHILLRSSKANRKEVFLLTDGLPESYTDLDGTVKSGQLDRAMDHALARAQELSTVNPLRFTMILLKSDHPEYEIAARRVTRTLGGSLVITDPEHLGVELLVRWAGGTETVRKAEPAEAPGPAPPTVPRPKSKKRRADRRMGG